MTFLKSQTVRYLKKLDIPCYRGVDAFKPFNIPRPILGAACLVLLSPGYPSIGSEAYRIFLGMIKVLNLSIDNVCVGWLSETLETCAYAEILMKVQDLESKTILMMGKRHWNVVMEGKEMMNHATPSDNYCQITYHPQELIEDPNLKREAYRELLCLKEKLLNLKQL